jgi:hypothetical protein
MNSWIGFRVRGFLAADFWWRRHTILPACVPFCDLVPCRSSSMRRWDSVTEISRSRIRGHGFRTGSMLAGLRPLFHKQIMTLSHQSVLTHISPNWTVGCYATISNDNLCVQICNSARANSWSGIPGRDFLCENPRSRIPDCKYACGTAAAVLQA